MDQNERRIIEDLFDKLRRVEGESPPRDPEAEDLIRRRLGEQPGAAYHMAQAIVVQEHALGAAQARVRELEQQLAQRREGGGFLSGLFGGGEQPSRPSGQTPARPRPDFARYGHAGGGFLGGAMQTALGVAGGVLIADAITDLFTSDEAAAAELPAEEQSGAHDLPERGGVAPGDEGLPEGEDVGGFFGDENF
jgi:uncharacterized protein